MAMKCKVSVRDNILFFDLAVLRAGEIDQLIEEAKTLIDQLEPPFFSISTLEKMFKAQSLLHPDDIEKFKNFGSFLNDKGRALSIWVVPENTILYKSSLQTVPEGGNIRRVDTMDEALGLVKSLL